MKSSDLFRPNSEKWRSINQRHRDKDFSHTSVGVDGKGSVMDLCLSKSAGISPSPQDPESVNRWMEHDCYYTQFKKTSALLFKNKKKKKLKENMRTERVRNKITKKNKT